LPKLNSTIVTDQFLGDILVSWHSDAIEKVASSFGSF